MKKCCRCGKEKSLKEFRIDKDRKDGHTYACRECLRIYDKKYRNSPHGKGVKRRRYRSLKGYLSMVYNDIKKRCTKPNCKSYKHYGGRGIKLNFTYQELLNWCVAKKIDPHGLTIDRIDNNGNYALANIRFVTRAENLKNRRTAGSPAKKGGS